MTSCGQAQGKDFYTPQAINLEFSEKYDLDHAQHYFKKHRAGFSRRLSTWREVGIARRALELAGDPCVVLDLPCGAGRFWPMLAEKPDRRILAADNSEQMLQVAAQMQPRGLVERVERFQCSAFEIKLADGSVDCIFCMRLLHHLIEPSHRLAMLREFHRVTRGTVCLSLWVDGNYQAYRRAKLEARRSKAGPQNRAVVKRQTIESEFMQAGFRVEGHFDFLRFYSMWRIYVLHKE
ncbi:MAG TPA: class I SAM-dependent methyltransferase [Sedimentisphaerales bacterium]|nr:class I SAM-dependent methyltransferase [Sedimentisphaerales bacterium]HOV76396.1 class I SAM-dependent methyltransferase [Sedimentisphaerales bacterium]